MKRLTFKTAIALLLLLSFAALLIPATRATAQAEPDWKKATSEATDYLSALIKINTTQPAGNELDAARYLKTICDREGIESQIFESAKNRGNFIARLKGDGSARPILLLSHLDTVGVEPKLWSVDPFSGLVKDGYIWGRGAQDDKNILTAELVAMLLIKRSGVKLRRDIILLGEADEEQGTGLGIEWMLKNHPEAIDAEFAVNEGGNALLDDVGRLRYVAIQTTEKVPVNIKLSAKGIAGHASIPRPDNPIVHLARAINIAGNYETPVQLTDTTRQFFSSIARVSDAADKNLFDSLVKNNDQTELMRIARDITARNLRFGSLLRTSIAPTIMNGGFQNNVIPGTAEANLNVRMIAGDTSENVINQLKRAINDPAITYEATGQTRKHLPASSTTSEMYRAFVTAVKRMAPQAAIAPTMSTWATDSSQLRERGVEAYGVLWPATTAEEATFHSNDERIRISSLGFGVELLWRVLMETAVKK